MESQVIKMHMISAASDSSLAYFSSLLPFACFLLRQFS
jgi:hypothetical protein